MVRHSGLSIAALALALCLTGVPAAAQGIVRVYNWSDYIDESILEDFTAKTGIKVVYDVYDSNDILETKLLAGGSGYDVVFPSGNFLARQIQAGVFQKLDKAALPNLKNLDPEIMARTARYDPGNEYGVPYMWGTTGIAYNEDMIRKRMPDAPVNSWKLVFVPENAAKFADCGIYVLDAPDEMFPAALQYLGLDPDTKEVPVLEKAVPVLAGLRPSVRKFHSSENINALANGDICLAIMWSGDAQIAATRAEEAGKDFTIKFAIPQEGAQMWFDMMAIPKDAPNRKEALAFINFLMEPEVIAKATNYVTYPNANKASLPFIDVEIRNNPVIYPSPAVMQKLFVVTPYDQKVQKQVTRLWQQIKAGQ